VTGTAVDAAPEGPGTVATPSKKRIGRGRRISAVAVPLFLALTFGIPNPRPAR
jgi:hypothetical protein